MADEQRLKDEIVHLQQQLQAARAAAANNSAIVNSGIND